MSLSWSLKLYDQRKLNQWRGSDQMMPASGAHDGFRAKQKASWNEWQSHRSSLAAL